jgi:DNA end-binding protein Ku
LHYGAEVKPTSAFSDELADIKPSAQELKLTKMLMDGLTEKKFDISRYSDTYMERLTALIQAKVEGKELVSPQPTHEPRVINLMDALKASLEQVKPDEAAKAAPRARASSKTSRERKPATRSTTKKRKSG